MINDLQIEQFVKYFDGTSTPEENREIIRWRKSKQKNEQLFEELQEVWRITGKISEDFQPDTSMAWRNVSKKIDDYENVAIKPNRGNNISYYISRVAAVFIIGVAIYLMFELNNHSEKFSEQLATKYEMRDLVLPDGSRVWLNENSLLKYSKSFDGDERIVKLEGEGYFEVVKNPNKPFVVVSENSRIEVLGTSFDYFTKENESDIVIVNSGKVKFSELTAGNNKVVLTKGEKAELIVLDKSIKKSLNNDINYLAWKTGKLMFENKAFDEMINTISKYYKRNFEIKTDSLKSSRLTVAFDNQTLEDVLKIIELTMDVTCTVKSQIIIIN